MNPEQLANYIARHANWRKLARSTKYTRRTHLGAIPSDLFHSIGQYTAAELYADYSRPIITTASRGELAKYTIPTQTLEITIGNTTNSARTDKPASALLGFGPATVLQCGTELLCYNRNCELLWKLPVSIPNARSNLHAIIQAECTSTIVNLLTGQRQHYAGNVKTTNGDVHIVNCNRVKYLVRNGYIIGRLDYSDVLSTYPAYPLYAFNSSNPKTLHVIDPYTCKHIGVVQLQTNPLRDPFIEWDGVLKHRISGQTVMYEMRSRPYLWPGKGEIAAQCATHKMRGGRCKYCGSE